MVLDIPTLEALSIDRRSPHSSASDQFVPITPEITLALKIWARATGDSNAMTSAYGPDTHRQVLLIAELGADP